MSPTTPKIASSVTLGIGFSIDHVSLTPNKLEPVLCAGNTKFEYLTGYKLSWFHLVPPNDFWDMPSKDHIAFLG